MGAEWLRAWRLHAIRVDRARGMGTKAMVVSDLVYATEGIEWVDVS